MKTIKKISILMSLILAFSMFPVTAFAHPADVLNLSKVEIVIETSNPDIGAVFYVNDTFRTRAYHTKEKTGTGYFYKTSNGDKIADFSCTGTFSYDGTICNVTSVSTSVWNTIKGYRVDVSESKNQVSPTYARATGVFKLYDLGFLGIGDKLTSSATINVFCNQRGTTSTEFNGDY